MGGEASRALLVDVLGAEVVGEETLELRGERRGATITFDPAPDGRLLQGAGSIHHIAWGTTVAEHPRWHEHVNTAGVRSTPIIDRHFFHSIYFREPGGVLYEIADDGPGFAHDVPLSELGRQVVLPPWLEPRRAEIEGRLTPLPSPPARCGRGVGLPPWLEPRRAEIEARLTPLPDPRAGWPAGGSGG